MKAWRRPPGEADQQVWDQAPEEYPAEAESGGEQAGWVTVSPGAVANVSAVLRWGAWLLLIAGPLLAVAAFLRPVAAAGAPAPAPKSSVVVRDTSGPAGFAQLYVAAYVEAGKGTEASLAPYYPLMRDISLQAEPGAQHADRLAAVRVTQASPGYWSVTVAALVIPSSKNGAASGQTTQGGSQDEAGAGPVLRYFQVPVKAAGTGGGYEAAALPAEVAAPATGGEAPQLDYGAPVPADTHDPAVATISEFLAAYLTGGGELDRYLSPGTSLVAVSPAPYTKVSVTQLAEQGGDFAANAPVTEGARRELLVDVAATGTDGQVRPLTYALALKARAGRWEIAAVDAAPRLNTSKENQS
ncbi:conjugal transfer protein [Streptomyces sp. NPDC001817]|uniref:conjugal transfer protein n=1 Tax=Streptomyces sp. NPDC001817 TaxID=3154398 RepID=UPI00331F26B9